MAKELTMQRRFFRFSLLGILAILLMTSSAGAQTEGVAYYDLSAMAKWPLGKMQVNGTMGQTGSFAIAELPDGLRGNPHHHNQEQIVLGLAGMTEITIDGTPHRLGVHGAVLTPPNSQHSNANAGPGTAIFIEFQSVLRTDWFPPHQKFVPAVVAAPAPVSVPQGRQVFSDFTVSSDGWRKDSNGARSKVLRGQTIQVTVWDLSAPNASVLLDSKGVRPERFLYVLEGQPQLAVEGDRRDMTAQTLAVISPAVKSVQLRSPGKGRAIVAVFETSVP
jgi:quercetin dioxygenase-like cupin family protein